MIVIHPKDKTTAFLKLLYEGEEVTLLDQSVSNAEIRHQLNHTSCLDRIMMLGHGSENGLFSKKDDSLKEFDRLIISHRHRYYLRRHRGRLIGIWCNADAFA